jgi:2-amino-4-hydroxy-6-hydroxymethyldihydropteridine diphosphokinase
MSVSTPVALALGGNIGDVESCFTLALGELERAGLTNVLRSSIYHTKPVGFDHDVPDFLNAVVIGVWRGSPFDLHNECGKIEISRGRPAVRDSWTSRTLDLDIILFGNEIVSDRTLTIPHPEARKRFFVMSPLKEVAGAWIFPDTGFSVAETLNELAKTTSDNEVVDVVPW